MNEYDSSRMADMLHADNGMTQTDDVNEADVILLNTCSVREKAEEVTWHDISVPPHRVALVVHLEVLQVSLDDNGK